MGRSVDSKSIRGCQGVEREGKGDWLLTGTGLLFRVLELVMMVIQLQMY